MNRLEGTANKNCVPYIIKFLGEKVKKKKKTLLSELILKVKCPWCIGLVADDYEYKMLF